MLNAISIRTVLGLLVLAAPVMAIIPPAIDLQLDGAKQLSSFEYSVMSGDKVGLGVVAPAHSLIWAFALPLDKNGEWVDGILLPLLYEEDAVTGKATVEMKVPAGVTGMFEIKAVAISGSDVLDSATLRVRVDQAPAAPVLE